MRWMFRESNQPEEQERKEIEQQIATWWLEFEKNASDLVAFFKNEKQFDLPAWMESTLQSIDHNLCWEFGPALKIKGHRLVITPEATRNLRTLTDQILYRAPKLEGWEFYPYRLEENLDQANSTCEGRVGCGLDGATVSVAKGKHNRIDLKFCFPKSVDARTANRAAFVATETLLGEECLDSWVGVIETVPLREKRTLSLERLQPSVQALIGSIIEQLPDACSTTQASSQWTGYEVKPREREDYPQQEDVIYATTMRPDVWVAARQDALFFSKRFSRFHETFCYLKIDGEDRDPSDRLEERTELEEVLIKSLAQRNLGMQIGGSTGLRYSYIELALTDVHRAIPLLRETLQADNFPKRTWLLFHDCNLCTEWVGMWDETPPPPVGE